MISEIAATSDQLPKQVSNEGLRKMWYYDKVYLVTKALQNSNHPGDFGGNAHRSTR